MIEDIKAAMVALLEGVSSEELSKHG